MNRNNLVIKKLIVFASMILVLGLPNKCFAWGASGHKIVAKIAWNLLKPNVKDSVSLYLKQLTLADVANWMDEIRGDQTYAYMSSWHFIDIEKGGKFNPDSTDNIIGALRMAISQLKNRQNLSAQQVEMDIKILTHLVGDLHQPLHTGYPDDRGGNLISVFYNNNGTNLHKVWDTDIIEAEIINAPTTWSNVGQFNKEEYQELRKVNLENWLNDSRSKLDLVYDFKGDNLNHKYAEKNVPLIEKQLLIGGIRLASVLNSLFK